MTAPEIPRLAGHLLVEALIAQGIDTVFGVPGESYLAVLDGFYEYRDRIRFIACRHEGGAAFMAEAQGKLGGRPGMGKSDLALRLIGYPRVRNYVGSWKEWGDRADLPIEHPKEP